MKKMMSVILMLAIILISAGSIRNGRHSWPGVKLNGIDTNSLILEFFSTVAP